MNDHDLYIWVRGWEDTFTASGRSVQECHEWLLARLAKAHRAARK